MNSSDQGEGSIDFEALSRKYAEERAKRLRSDAIGQYQPLTGKLSAYARDPNADPVFTRDPVRRDAEVLVIGGGFGGLLGGVRSRPLRYSSSASSTRGFTEYCSATSKESGVRATFGVWLKTAAFCPDF